MRFRVLIGCVCLLGVLGALIAGKTFLDLRSLPESLDLVDSGVRKPRVVDRNGHALSVTLLNRWNTSPAPLHEFPELLRQAFIESEDRRFYRHGGVDWLARLHALAQDLRAMRAVRGASTITEQVVRMLHPRPRTVWSRWIEGIEAARIERRFSKGEILEFYLNQVPYGHQRRGVSEAARFYFDRDLDTLNIRETLALAVLVRAPSAMDLNRRPKAVQKGTSRLAGHMLENNLISSEQYNSAVSGNFEFARSERLIEASHFVQHVLRISGPNAPDSRARLVSTLDGDLQKKANKVLGARLEGLRQSDVRDGAALVVDNASGEVLAWVSAGGPGADSGSWIDAVLVPRQPGSTLKPFLYALALEMGWTPATLIDDSPLVQPVRSGLHNFHNYSRTCYGPLRLREALGNSLNTPAVRTIQFTGAGRFLDWLHLLGIRGLKQSADYYGLGLALGDGEVSLFELVQAYSVIARRGEFQPLRLIRGEFGPQRSSRRVMDEKTASLISDILSDPQARRIEFGEGHLLRFPVQTAVKTGTSGDHRDCWALGFSERYTAGVWMGNLDRRPTGGITGALGPALVLRALFAELNRYGEPRPLPMSSELRSVAVCAVTGLRAGPRCPVINEMFMPGSEPVETCSHDEASGKAAVRAGPSRSSEKIRPVQPVQGLELAIDPRIPADKQAFAFKLPRDIEPSRVEWFLDGKLAAETREGRYLWPLARGEHQLVVRIWRGADDFLDTAEVNFSVR